MGELALEHVEAQLARLRRRSRCPGTNLKRAAGIDEAADQPGRGDAVDLHALRASPRRDPSIRWARRRRPRCRFVVRSRRRPFVAGGPRGPTTRPSAGSRPSAPKKSMATIASSCLRSRAVWLAISLSAPSGRSSARRAASLARLGRDALRSPRRAPRRTAPATRRSDRPSTNARLADDRLAAALDDLLGEPGEVLARLAVGRQRIDRALHRHRAQRLQRGATPSPAHRRAWPAVDGSAAASAGSVTSSPAFMVHPYHTRFDNIATLVSFFSCIRFFQGLNCDETSVSKEIPGCLSSPSPFPSSRRASRARRRA